MAFRFGIWLLWASLAGAVAAQEATVPADPEDRGYGIFAEADRRDTGYGDSQVRVEMVLRDNQGRETRRLLDISQLEMPDDGDRVLMVFQTPKAVKGTALLSYSHRVAPDDQWLFLPAVRRVKKIAARNRSGPFLSSEFAIEDLTAREVDKYRYRFIREEVLDGEPCLLVERMPLDEFSGYSRQLVWVDQAEYRIMQVEYFDRRERLLKTLKVTDFRQYLGRYWRGHRMHMMNHQTGRSTELIWQEHQFRTGLTAEQHFSTNSLLRLQ